jgi:hypothetical protein
LHICRWLVETSGMSEGKLHGIKWETCRADPREVSEVP